MDFTVYKGSIVDAGTKAIVLPANSRLKKGPGASEAIFKAAGTKKLEDACKKIGYCDVGSAVVTPGFDLPTPYIIHAVVPKWIDGNHDEYALLSSAYLSSLQIADVINCESIAFPLLSSGNNGFDIELAFDIAKESIEKFQPNNIKEAQLILYREQAWSCAEKKGVRCHDLITTKPRLNVSDYKINDINKLKQASNELMRELFERSIEFLKNKENQEELKKIAIEIINIVMNRKKR